MYRVPFRTENKMEQMAFRSDAARGPVSASKLGLDGGRGAGQQHVQSPAAAGEGAEAGGLRKEVWAQGQLRAYLRDHRLVIVGDGPQRQSLDQLFGGQATFMGMLVGEELAEAYASADIFGFTGVCLLLLQSLHCGAESPGPKAVLREPSSVSFSFSFVFPPFERKLWMTDSRRPTWRITVGGWGQSMGNRRQLAAILLPRCRQIHRKSASGTEFTNTVGDPPIVGWQVFFIYC